MNKSILIVTWNFPPKIGGMEILNHDIYCNLKKHVDVIVIAPFSSNQESEDDIYRCPIKGFMFYVLYALLVGLYLLGKKRRYVLGGSLVVLPILVVYKFIYKIPVYAYGHGLDVIYDSRLYQKFIKLSIPFIDGIICNSINTYNLLENKFDNLKKVEIINPGIEIEQFNTSTVRPIDRKYLLFVGRLTERKGLINFIEHCFSNIAKEKHDIDLVIIGDDPKEAIQHKSGYKENLIKFIQQKNLENKIHIKGFVSKKELISFYQNCECLVLPVININNKNDVEGFGIVAIEAGACGKPTVAFDIDGVNEAVLNGKTGILIEKNNYFEMTDEIKNLINNKYSFENVKSIIKNHYSWNLQMKKILNFMFN